MKEDRKLIRQQEEELRKEEAFQKRLRSRDAGREKHDLAAVLSMSRKEADALEEQALAAALAASLDERPHTGVFSSSEEEDRKLGAAEESASNHGEDQQLLEALQ